MQKLSQKEWIAVGVALVVVGIFFFFPQVLGGIMKDNEGAVSEALQLEDGTNETTMTTTQDGLIIEDSGNGTGEEAKVGDTVTVHYVGTFQDGSKFDSSVDRGTPFSFTLGENRVIAGWEKGVLGMKVGAKRKLVVPPALGYGPQTYGPIPGNSTLIFEIQLLEIN